MYPALIITPLIFIVAYFISLQRYLNQLQPATETVRRQFGDMNAVLAESIEGIETVKGAAQEDQAIEKFESRRAGLSRCLRARRATSKRASCPCSGWASPTRSGWRTR